MPSSGRISRVEKKKKKSNNLTQELGSLVKLLKENNLIERQQLRYGQPNTMDIEFPMVRPRSYTVVSNVTLPIITTSTSVPMGGAYAFTLSQLPNYTVFTACFDRYRILCVQVQFNPAATVTSDLSTAIDYDDANSPTAEIQQRDTGMVVPCGNYFERTFRPRIAVAAYSGAFTSYANMPSNLWIDCASPQVQYFGLKYYVPVSASNSNIYLPTARFLIELKNNF
jgi:hypothetical protein